MTAETDAGAAEPMILADHDEAGPPAATTTTPSSIDETIDAISKEFEALGDSPSMADALRARASAPARTLARPAPAALESLASRTISPNRQLMARVQKALKEADPVVVSGKVTRASGIIVEATLPQVAVGTACVIEVGDGRLIPAEVVGFARSRALLMPFGELAGIGEGCSVWPRASAAEIPVGEALLGRVVDAGMRPVDGLGTPSLNKTAALNAAPPPAMQRRRITRPLVLGIRSLDSCLTCGEGQRVGIMAGPGVGKSVLLGMLARSASADVIVCGLVGERGREVREFVERDLGPAGLARSVVVVATADEPPLVRVRAAMAATAIAEFFRARGKKVLLLIDSLSRVAMAQREIGLAAGEPPTSRGYPPSVFAALPRLVERAGNDAGEGSITAMYTVLAEGDDLSDPVADAARAALDGHVVLSRKLANAGHFPAVDVLASVSRVMSDVVTPEHRRLAMEAREVLSTYRDSADLIEVGAYAAGSNPRVDRALRSIHAVNALFRQEPGQRFALENTLLGLRRALETPGPEVARG
ncbi:MAG TPA: FliI/YscN family ATPase [Polyangia bacterium]|jgi:flagellum-specific ATP synthase|nr:FliI/YscN family ATPase [Polyangia bacterium]